METKLHKRKTFMVTILIMIALVIAVGYAWFAYKHKLASLTKVNSPGDVSIAGVHGGEMNGINLSYESKDVSNSKIVTVQNVICIRSNSDEVRLEVAHTQNVEGLILKLYPATESEGTTSSEENTSTICKKYKDKNYYYSYYPNKGYSTDGNSGLELLIKNEGKGQTYTYGDNETRVQSQAVPIYWESKEYVPLEETKNNMNNSNLTNYNYYKYFIVEASWWETDKETDIVYVMAKQ